MLSSPGPLGWDFKAAHSWEDMIDGIGSHIRRINWDSKTQLRSKAVKYYNKHASFVDKHTLKLTDRWGKTEIVT